MTTLPTFDLQGPLPTGVTVLEASAGTGKTYSIAHLVVRLVAEEGVPVDQLLVVTFTRLATAELRERLRARVAQAGAALRGEAVEDPLLADWAAQAPAAERDTWRRRLDLAREDFDAASISTIHGFCQRMLQANAFESGASFDLELLPDLSEPLDEIVSDWLTLERYGTGDAEEDAWREAARAACGLDPGGALSLARAVGTQSNVAVLGADGPSLSDWRAAVDAARALAAADGPSPFDRVWAAREAKRLNRRSYTEKRLRARWEAILGWLDEAPAPVGLSGVAANTWYFQPDTLEERAEGDLSDVLAHPFIQAWGALPGLWSRVARAERARFLLHVRQRLDAALAQRFQQGFEHLLADLAQALRHPTRGPLLRAAIRERYQVGLIDEFQDTDALQWEIFQRVFAPAPGEPPSGHRLVLIGDPKQAIYAFRGANVHVYLRARREAGAAFTMTRNHRSDRRLIDGLNHLMDHPGLFGDPPGAGIQYVAVDTPEREPAVRLDDPGAPVQIRFFDGALRGDPEKEARGLSKTEARGLLPADVVRQVVETLDRRPRIHEGGAWRPLHPGDLAVLVSTNDQASDVQDALREAGVPAVVARNRSVFASEAAADLQRWLEALARAGQEGPARALAVTDLVGWTAATLGAGEAAAWAGFVGRIEDWRQQYARDGFMRAFRRMLDDLGVRARLLRAPRGERRVTDLLHLAELAHSAEKESGLGLSGLLGWLREHRDDPGASGDEAEARLETDARAVRILTMHSSKGLEFPVVFAPYLWDGSLIRRSEVGRLVVPAEDDPVQRVLDLRPAPPKDDPARLRLEAERRAERVRLMYVALTRARLRVVVWWGHLATARGDSFDSALAGLFHGASPEGARLAAGQARVRAASSDDLKADLDAISAGSGGAVSVEVVQPGGVAPWQPAETAPPALAPRRFRRGGLDRSWALHSYSSLTRGAAAPAVADPPDQPGLDPDAVTPASAPDGVPVPAAAADVPLAAFPAGAEAGTCLHAFFEVFDFRRAHPDVGEAAAEEAVLACLTEQLPRHGFDPRRHATVEVVRGLRLALQTPLGGPAGGLRLCDLSPGDRFDELRFDLPLAGGRGWAPGQAAVAVEDLADALSVAPIPGIRPTYIEHLRGLPFGRKRLAGFMTGFIDLVFRHPETGAFFVVDYKSNRLDPHRTRASPPSHFTPPHMQAEMEHHHYHLQYLLYSVAVRRFLRHRLGAAFDPDHTLAGSYYLFFRGMLGEPLGPDGAAPRGVFVDRPPAAVLDALDDLFGRPGGAA